MDYTNDYLQELTPERKKAFENYVSLQEDFKTLNDKAILTNFRIEWVTDEQEEIDIDLCTQEQKDKLDSFDRKKGVKLSEKKKLQREEYIKTLPHRTDKTYEEAFIVAPFFVQDSLNRKAACLDSLNTETIVMINERTSNRINLYKDFLIDGNI